MDKRVKLEIATEVPTEIVHQLDSNKYNFVKNDKTDNTGLVGYGNRRIVYLVQEKKSLKLFIAKFKKHEEKEFMNTLLWKDVAYAKDWADLLNNPVESKVEGNVLFQTYVDGFTLQQWLVTDPIKQLKDPTWTLNNDMRTGLLFEDSERSLYVKEKLILFYCRMLLNDKYVADLHNENIIFSDIYDDWVIVDGKQIFNRGFKQTLRRYPKKMKYKIKSLSLRNKIKNLIWEIRKRITHMKKINYDFSDKDALRGKFL